MAELVGYKGDVKIGSTNMEVTEWSASIKAEELDTTNKQSGGWRTSKIGLRVLEGSASGQFNAIDGTTALVQPQEDVSFELQVGDPSATAGETKITFTGNIFDLERTSGVDGLVEYTFNFKSSGVVTETINS